MIIRVANIWIYYEGWKKREAEFLTEPREHELEIRCYIHDPGGLSNSLPQFAQKFESLAINELQSAITPYRYSLYSIQNRKRIKSGLF